MTNFNVAYAIRMLAGLLDRTLQTLPGPIATPAPIVQAIAAAERVAGLPAVQPAPSATQRIPLFLQSHPDAACVRLSADGNHSLDLCLECANHLRQNTVPPHSLARVDNGIRPADLPLLTIVEERLLALIRVIRSLVVCRPATSHIRPEEGHLKLRAHIVGFRAPGPSQISKVFPPRPSQVADLISIVLVGAAQTYEDAVELARRSPALQVRGKVVAAAAQKPGPSG